MPFPQSAQARISEDAVRDTIAAVFRDPRYHETSLSDQFWNWVTQHILYPLIRAIARWIEYGQAHPVFGLLSLILASVLVALLVVHLNTMWDVRGRARKGALLRRAGDRSRDPWLVAQEAAARGQFTDAAHALYEALLEAAARRGDVRLHQSKTVGDYAREMRSRSSSLLARFRDFARSYEVVIYGIGQCDRERYERLLAIARPIILPNG